MNKIKKLSAVLLVMTFLVTLVPQNAHAGRHKEQYGHSKFKCWWSDVEINIFGLNVKESNNLH
tara:strand:+ start:229 stop:417 length:189 start_codon:yes stop_codon:yes gene_type:complete